MNRMFTGFTRHVNVADLWLNYDPEAPQKRFRNIGIAATKLKMSARLPGAVPWPAGWAPTAAPLNPAPAASDDLTRFRGYDAVVVTWTAAEAAALAALFTPEYLPSAWYEYRHDVASYVPLVTGTKAPFNDASADNARYYHSLGLYFPCTIGNARVLLFKSGLHLDYDGPQIPLRTLIGELAEAIQPKIFITTGTGGGIGSDSLLADVAIATHAQFDCVTQFKAEPWHAASYATAPLPAGALGAITPALLQVNAAKVPGARAVPMVWNGPSDAVVTTDFFGFDDSTDYYKLQGLGRVCDMGDAMVAQAMQAYPDIAFYSIRNVSDPQIPNPNNDIEAAGQKASKIYAEYGAFTTASSVIATWAVIYSAVHGNSARKRHHAA